MRGHTDNILCSTMIRRLLKALAVLDILVAIVLNLYIRNYPLIKSGCSWNPEASVKLAAFGDPQIPGLPPFIKGWYVKHLDVLGNDKYLKSIASAIRKHLKPDYVAVMGDLLSSQWIDDYEFSDRYRRYSKIFPKDEPGEIFNVSGNHDIGYHGDFTQNRIERFQVCYGELNFVAYQSPEYRIVVINSMSLDGPPDDDEWRKETVDFLDSIKDYQGSSILLNHIPQFKPNGICMDDAKFEFYDFEGHQALRSQNHMTSKSTNLILTAVFGGSDKEGLILAGHDHEGCECSYDLNKHSQIWELNPKNTGRVKEVTVRSMMGDYGGNTGLVSGLRSANGEIKWEYSLCRFHVQHIWWVTQVTTYLTLAVPFLYIF